MAEIDPLPHRLMIAACAFETLGNQAHDPTLTTTTCAEHGRLLRELEREREGLRAVLTRFAGDIAPHLDLDCNDCTNGRRNVRLCAWHEARRLLGSDENRKEGVKP